MLIRALEPLEGIEAMQQRRGLEPIRSLCSGPGKLTQALGIGLEHNGTDLRRGPVMISPRPAAWREVAISADRRIGITRAVELPWRFSRRREAGLSRGWCAGRLSRSAARRAANAGPAGATAAAAAAAGTRATAGTSAAAGAATAPRCRRRWRPCPRRCRYHRRRSRCAAATAASAGGAVPPPVATAVRRAGAPARRSAAGPVAAARAAPGGRADEDAVAVPAAPCGTCRWWWSTLELTGSSAPARWRGSAAPSS